MATKEKKAKAKAPATKAGPQPRADINGWVLCPGDNVLIVSPGEEYHGLFGKVDAFPTILELSCYVQIDGRPSTVGRVLVPNAHLRWMGPGLEQVDQLRPTRPGQRVRVVLDNESLATPEMKALDGQLGEVTEFGPLYGESVSMITVKFDDPALLPAAINSFDLIIVPTPVVHYVPEPEVVAEHPAIEGDSDLPFLDNQVAEQRTHQSPKIVATVPRHGTDGPFEWNEYGVCPNPTCAYQAEKGKREFVKITVAQTPDGDWVTGHDFAAADSGSSSPTSLAGERYETLGMATTAGVRNVLARSTAKELAPSLRKGLQNLLQPVTAPAEVASAKPNDFAAIQAGLVAHQAGLRLVPLASIVVTTNTRKVFDETALAELAESVRAHGILQPIVLRPHGTEAGKYELVAGGRRYRAAHLAELAEVPATVRNLTDRQFLEVQLLENLQRVDVRPADEAEAFAKLLNNGFALEEIAAKVGKPARFVAERARLMELLPEWVEALQQGRLLIGSAQLLARLTRTQQAEAHQYLDSAYGDKVDVAGTMRRLYSAADIRQHLDRQFKTHDLERAAFSKDDATLYPAAGACLTCPKRTGNTPYLFDEMGGNTCLDGGCFAEKSARYVAQVAAEIGAGGQPVLKVANHWGRVPADVLNLNKYKSVDSFRDNEMSELRQQGRVRPALMTEGAQAGQIVEIVLDAAVASKPDVVAAIKEEKLKQSEKEKQEAAKVRALGAARRQAYYQLSTDVRGAGEYTAVVLRRMLLSDLQYGRHKAVREMLQQVYGWGELSTSTYMDERERKQLAGYLSEMDTPALQSLLLDLQLVTWLYEEHPSNLPALCKQLGWSDEELLAAHAERKKGKNQEVPA